MKNILFAIAILLSISVSAQTDSSQLQLPIKLNLKVKYWGQMGSYLVNKSAFSDTALKCIGSGNPNQYDSLSSGTVRAGRFLQFMQQWVEETSGTNYSLLNELITSTAANGGIVAQLNVLIANGTANEKKIAQWLKTQVQALMARKAAVGEERTTLGIANLQALSTKISDQ